MKKVKVSYIAVKDKVSGSFYKQKDYSKYLERLKMRNNLEITEDEIYGLEQAKDHIREIKERLLLNEKNNTNKVFQIVRLTAIEEVLIDCVNKE